MMRISSGLAGRGSLFLLSNESFSQIERWIYYMETPGPLSICIVNMVIVFAVLIFLAFVIQLIHVIDPTKNKKK